MSGAAVGMVGGGRITRILLDLKPNFPLWFFHSARGGIASIVSQCSTI
jgi:hypothetical protein